MTGDDDRVRFILAKGDNCELKLHIIIIIAQENYSSVLCCVLVLVT